MTHNQAVEYLLDIPKFASKTNHDTIRYYMEQLENPHLCCKTIHVAGTNGKGSVCAYLASILKKAGYKVGLFTSPHLVHIHERFKFNGEDITEEDFLEAFETVYSCVTKGIKQGKLHPNFFEFLFMMAAVWYKKMQADYVIYETGLGGRLDATNILQPALTLLTQIGMDHMQYLGNDLESIAWEKAGILKPGIPCVWINQRDDATQVILDRSKELQVPMKIVEEEEITIHEIKAEGIDFSYGNRYDIEGEAVIYHIPLTGIYQVYNAVIALQGIRLLLPDLEEAYIQQGIQDMYWPGRMEALELDVYVDGAHNEPAIRSFCKTVRQAYMDKGIILLFAVSKDKDYSEMIRIIGEQLSLEQLILTTFKGERGASVEDIRQVFSKYVNCPIVVEENLAKAYANGREQLQGKQRLFCVGSLYLVGELEGLQEEV